MTLDTVQSGWIIQKLLSAHAIVALTGAGISKESGIPTYREPLQGLWAQYDPRDLATPDGFRANPGRAWAWHEFRRQEMLEAKPNAGHIALAEMGQLLPGLTILTQNIDGLHQAAGSQHVIELHGSIHRHKCFANCQGNPTLLEIERLTERSADGVPLCPHCGAWARPDVVFFEEIIPDGVYREAIALVDTANVLLTVGTSGAVMPASSFPYRAKRWNDAFVIDVNPNANELTPYADIHLAASAGKSLPHLVQTLKDALPPSV